VEEWGEKVMSAQRDEIRWHCGMVPLLLNEITSAKLFDISSLNEQDEEGSVSAAPISKEELSKRIRGHLLEVIISSRAAQHWNHMISMSMLDETERLKGGTRHLVYVEHPLFLLENLWPKSALPMQSCAHLPKLPPMVIPGA
jgi:hypothetical protein